MPKNALKNNWKSVALYEQSEYHFIRFTPLFRVLPRPGLVCEALLVKTKDLTSFLPIRSVLSRDVVEHLDLVVIKHDLLHQKPYHLNRLLTDRLI